MLTTGPFLRVKQVLIALCRRALPDVAAGWTLDVQRVFFTECAAATQQGQKQDQLKLSFALWTRDAVRLAIKQIYGRDLPLRTISGLSETLGIYPTEAD